jgi:hypothetical protein
LGEKIRRGGKEKVGKCKRKKKKEKRKERKGIETEKKESK